MVMLEKPLGNVGRQSAHLDLDLQSEICDLCHRLISSGMLGAYLAPPL